MKKLKPYTPLTPAQILPNKPGWYFWYILDMHYLEVGSVHVLKDNQKHMDYLKTKPESKDFYLYQIEDGTWLTMYHQGHKRPPLDKGGLPMVDGYREFEFDWLTENEDRERKRQQGLTDE